MHPGINLIPERSVAGNIMLGHEPRRFGLINRRRMQGEVEERLERYGIAIRPGVRVSSLGLGMQRIVATARGIIDYLGIQSYFFVPATAIIAIIVAVVIGGNPLSGGRVAIVGCVFGAMLLGLIQNIINQIGTLGASYQALASGAFLLVAVIMQSLLSQRRAVTTRYQLSVSETASFPAPAARRCGSPSGGV